jgi:hypothetical protein
VDFGGLFFLALVWAIVKLVSKSREASAPTPRSDGSRPGLGPLQDPPQEEGRALRMLLQELERAAERSSGRTGRRPPRPPARIEEVDRRRTLEVAPRAESLEAAPSRVERVDVDQDEEAEQVIARRAAATAARSAARTPARRGARLDPRLQQQPADRTATRPLTPQQLRDAVVWREILGPPVSERDR